MKPSHAARLACAFASLALVLTACGGGGGSPAPVPTVIPTLTPTLSPTSGPTSTPIPEAYFQCPTSDTAPNPSIARAASASSRGTHHDYAHGGPHGSMMMNAIAVTYGTSTLNGERAMVASRMSALHQTVAREMTFSHIGKSVQILNVPEAKIASTMQSLRLLPGVLAVAQLSRRRALSASPTPSPVFPNDPYFNGFTTLQGATPATYHVGPYEESASIYGQWDMHAIGLEYAFGYTLGRSSVKLAIIDTGEDLTSPDLPSAHVGTSACFISDENNVQSTSRFTTDPIGHGTDVAGLALADINNSVGYVGAGGETTLMAYRVFPFPDTTCDNENPNGDGSCGANSVDIASAINDAVANGANVISMSFGGPSPDTDPELSAVENAIAAGVTVVAAAGNDNGITAGYTPGQPVSGSNPAYSPSLEAPGSDPGVIAVGATSLDDGQPNGSGALYGGTAVSPVEYVAEYSDYASPNTTDKATSWGLVAPGGDGCCGGNDNDNFHWTQNIWTSTPADATFSWDGLGDPCPVDESSAGGTAVDSTVDCYTEIDGTSMATPHVAGAAALILSVGNANYKTPSEIFNLLCTTADPVPATPGQGCGRLDINRAMIVAQGGIDPGPPSSPY